MAYTLVPTELIVDGAITSAKLDTNIAITGTLGVTGVVTLATHLVMGDNDKIKIGTGGDLEIYHDGSNSYISNSTGNIYLGDTNGSVHIQAKLNEESIICAADGAVSLYHDNAVKLATTSTGIDVTGTVHAVKADIDISTDARLTINDIISEVGDGNVALQAQNSAGSALKPMGFRAEDIRFATGSSERLRIRSDGGVGINSSGYAGQPLTVNAGSGDYVFYGESTDAICKASFRDNSSTANIEFGASGNNHIFSKDGATQMTIDSSGNLLVGNTVVNPASGFASQKGFGYAASTGKVEIATDANGAVMEIGKNNSNDGSILVLRKQGNVVGSIGTEGGDIVIGTGDTAVQFADSLDCIRPFTSSGSGNSGRDNAIDLGASGQRFKDIYLSNTIGNGAGEEITFNNAQDYLRFDTLGSERMRIDSSGDVRIGSITNAYAFAQKLRVGDGNDNDGITINSGSTHQGNLAFCHGSGGNTAFGRISYQHGTNYMQFFTNNTERMRIDSSGATLVNTTSKTNSGTRLGVWADSGSVSIETRCKANVSYFPLANYSAAGSYIGGINATTTATSLATSSDQRLKENIADADDAGSKIDAIQVRQYDWKVNGSHQDYGMIAQELREIIPDVIHESPDEEKMLSVDYAGLVPMLIKEIQSLRNRVAQLEE